MNINKLEWGKCPECDTLINGWQFYPADVVQENGMYATQMDCPSCNHRLLVKLVVTAKIEMEVL